MFFVVMGIQNYVTQNYVTLDSTGDTAGVFRGVGSMAKALMIRLAVETLHACGTSYNVASRISAFISTS